MSCHILSNLLFLELHLSVPLPSISLTKKDFIMHEEMAFMNLLIFLLLLPHILDHLILHMYSFKVYAQKLVVVNYGWTSYTQILPYIWDQYMAPYDLMMEFLNKFYVRNPSYLPRITYSKSKCLCHVFYM